MPKFRPPVARMVVQTPNGAGRMPNRVMRRLHDEQGFRDLCAQAAPLRCRR
jgi:hypothetical protein